ncbi:MAG: cyclic nucleotide-binding domain-containing protein [Opitutaceae bacterium]
MAASVLVRKGGEVYRTRFLWQRPVPHFSVDLSDACLQAARVRATLELAKYTPLSLMTAGALYLGDGWALPLLAGFFFAFRPLGKGVPGRIFALMRCRSQLDTDHSFEFSLNRRPAIYWRAWWRGIDWGLIGVELAYAGAWTFAVTWVALGALGMSGAEMLADWSYWRQCLPWLGGAVVLMFVYILVRQLYELSLEKLRRARRWLRLAWARWRSEVKFPDTEAALMKLVGSNVLLGQLNLYDQALIARELRPVQFKAWKSVVAFDETPKRVGLIFSGRAVGCGQLKSGRSIPLVKLVEGDIFGAHALVDSVHPSLEVRSCTPLAVMMIPAHVFKKVVVEKLGAAMSYDLTHKYAFLSRLPLCEHWYGHALGRFSKLSKVVDVKDGERIVIEGSDLRAFFIVYEGQALVTRQGKQVGVLKAGDYFGEIGLLQNSSAVAEVSALGDMRCLQIGRAEFLRFVAHNHHVALQLEQVSSKRLGRPIFPLIRYSFEER